MKQKNSLSRKERNVNNEEWTRPVFKWVSKESQMDRLVCRIKGI